MTTETPTPAHDHGVQADLEEYLRRLQVRWTAVFAPALGPDSQFIRDDELGGICRARAVAYLGCLRSADAATAQAACHDILRHLIGRELWVQPTFWRSRLARAIAWHVGYAATEAPRDAVANLLGVSRQRVHQLVLAGVLEGVGAPRAATEPGSVSPVSVCRAFRRYWRPGMD